MKNEKVWWASKTIWANVLALIATLATVFGLDLGLTEEAQASILAGVMAVVNVVLRLVTSAPVTAKKPDGLRAAPLAVAGAVILTLLLAACASQVAETPAQRVFALKADYGALLAPTVAYESLPRCDETDAGACSELEVVEQLRRADNHAWDALEAAEDAVRAPGATSDSIALALSVAREAVGALRSILTREGVLP